MAAETIDTEALKARIKEWRDNAIRNAENANNSAKLAAENGQTFRAFGANRRAVRYVAQAEAYIEVLKLLN